MLPVNPHKRFSYFILFHFCRFFFSIALCPHRHSLLGAPALTHLSNHFEQHQAFPLLLQLHLFALSMRAICFTRRAIQTVFRRIDSVLFVLVLPSVYMPDCFSCCCPLISERNLPGVNLWMIERNLEANRRWNKEHNRASEKRAEKKHTRVSRQSTARGVWVRNGCGFGRAGCFFFTYFLGTSSSSSYSSFSLPLLLHLHFWHPS